MNFLEERNLARKKEDDEARKIADALSDELRSISEQITAFFDHRSTKMIMADMEDTRTVVVEANSSKIATITAKSSGRYEIWFMDKSGNQQVSSGLSLSDLADALIDHVPR